MKMKPVKEAKLSQDQKLNMIFDHVCLNESNASYRHAESMRFLSKWLGIIAGVVLVTWFLVNFKVAHVGDLAVSS